MQGASILLLLLLLLPLPLPLLLPLLLMILISFLLLAQTGALGIRIKSMIRSRRKTGRDSSSLHGL